MKKLLQTFIRFAIGLVCIASISACSSFMKEDSNAHAARFELKKRWVRTTTQEVNLKFRKINRARPVLVGDLVIQANGVDGIKAYDQKTASIKWSLPIDNGVETSPAIINERLFFPANDGKIYSVDAKTGEVVWSFESKFENLGEPVVSEGNVYFVTGANILFALDAATGKQMWVYARQDSSNFSIRGGAKPLVHNGTIFAGFSDGSVVALKAASGTILWENSLNRNKRFRDIDANIVLDKDQVLVSGYDDKLYSLNPETGEVKWRLDGGSYSGPTIYESWLLYPTTQGQVWAIDRKTGDKKWVYKSKGGLPSEIQILGKWAVFGESQGAIVALDVNTGVFVDDFEPGRGVLSSLAVDTKDRSIYFISGEANLYSLTLQEAMTAHWP